MLLTALSADSIDPDRPLWLRHPSVSPDGKNIAFTYGGQIWRVSSSGGEAIPYTGGDFYASYPIWSPDGKYMAFASKRYGNFDIFVLPASGGGEAKRLTYHSNDDIPLGFSSDSKNIYFKSSRLGSKEAYIANPPAYPFNQQLYSVSLEGGKERIVIPTPVFDLSADKNGNFLLYSDVTSVENEWRKHAISDATKDIWLYELQEKTHKKMSDFRGEDRNPVVIDDKSYYYLSERSGSFNVWKGFFDGSEPKQITFHEKHPVRFLTLSNHGVLTYGYDGEIWRKSSEDSVPMRVNIRISQSYLLEGEFYKDSMRDATEIALSPNGLELAVVVRGDIFVVSTLSGKSRKVTSTPEQERSIGFSDDGSALVYSSERGGKWGLYIASIAQGERLFLEAPFIREERIDIDGDIFSPKISSRGKIAYVKNRKTVEVLDLSEGKITEIFNKPEYYSYDDRDMFLSWSPDSEWVAIEHNRFFRDDVYLVRGDGRGEPINITKSGYTDERPYFTDDGKSIIWSSDRNGLRDYNAESGQSDIYRIFLSKEALREYKLSQEEKLLARDGVQEADISTPKTIEKDVGCTIRKLTPFSLRPLYYRLLPDNETLFLVASQFPTGLNGYISKPLSGEFNQIFNYPGLFSSEFAMDKEARVLFFLGHNGIARFDFEQNSISELPFDANVAWSTKEVGYIFEHTWRLMRDKFYDKSMHGVDWGFYKKEYEKFLPYIFSWIDFAELLNEMSGELNASHIVSRFKEDDSLGDKTSSLGVFYDHSFEGEGVRIDEVLDYSPLDGLEGVPKRGAVIVSIDGKKIEKSMDVYTLLNRKSGKKLYLEIYNPNSKKSVLHGIVPISLEEEGALARNAWVERKKESVDKLSNGRLGYVYIDDMSSTSYRQAFSKIFGEFDDKEGLLIDIRYNTGGNLHDELVAMLDGKSSGGFEDNKGVKLLEFPFGRWTKPTTLLVNAYSYSDAMVFPYIYKANRLGTIVGDRVPGTGTFTLNEVQQESRLSYMIPQLGVKGIDGKWLENNEVKPDTLIRNDPNLASNGRDIQLEEAVKEMLKGL